MKRFKDFLIENKQDKWVHKGGFTVIKGMVIDGKMIKDKIPDEVTGSFDCLDLELTTLEGCPSKIGGSFYCGSNKLISLKGAPITINGYFNCSYNKLTSLEGCPTTVGGNFDCSYNKLISLEGCPTIIDGSFYSQHNKLTSLEGGPTTVSGNFYCSNKLTSLKGGPTTVSGNINCNANLQNLTIEHNFIKSGKYSSQSTYWQDLLKYMTDEKIDLDKITTWPEGFLSNELIQSIKVVSKYNL